MLIWYHCCADKDQSEPPAGCVATSALCKCEHAETKAKEIAADDGFTQALNKLRFRKSANTARLFLQQLGNASSPVVQVCCIVVFTL
jgi:hypothetical protein